MMISQLGSWDPDIFSGRSTHVEPKKQTLHLEDVRLLLCLSSLRVLAMENGPFIDDFPIKTSIYKGFSMAMLNNQMR